MKKICEPSGKNGKIIYGTKSPNFCYKTFPIEDFWWNNKSKGIRYNNCPSCKLKARARRYDKNPEMKQRHLAVQAATVERKRVKLRSKINEIKLNSGCVDCGGIFHPIAMDFDHVRGTKKYGISRMIRIALPLDKILKEIEKCEVRCANCHRVKSHEELLQRAAINNPVLI